MNINQFIEDKVAEVDEMKVSFHDLSVPIADCIAGAKSEQEIALETAWEIIKPHLMPAFKKLLRSSLQELVGEIRKEVRDTFWKVAEDLENATTTHPAESEWNSGMRQAKAKVLTNLNHLLSLLPEAGNK